ncbi:MAG TPA: hypothetical protein VFQ61_27870 [Polyangiaceae bacterium]|nr:hypothetical protein [Polyangiaceae bacterium]
MNTARAILWDIAFVAAAVLPAAGFAAGGSLKTIPRAMLLAMLVALLATLWAPFRRLRGSGVPNTLYNACLRCFQALSLVLLPVGLFASSMFLLLAIFPPYRQIQGNSMPVMPIAQAFGALILGGGLGLWIWRTYFRNPQSLWRRMSN